VSQSLDDINARGIDASLKRADIGPVDLRAMRQFFLRQVTRPSKPYQIYC
jgi:hypothetical protein